MVENNSAFVGHRIKFWLFSDDEVYIGDCHGIFLEGNSYFYMIAFSDVHGSEVVAVSMDDIRQIKKLKKISENLTVVKMSDVNKNTKDGIEN